MIMKRSKDMAAGFVFAEACSEKILLGHDVVIIIIIITVFITRLSPKDTKRQVLLLQGVGRILRYKT